MINRILVVIGIFAMILAGMNFIYVYQTEFDPIMLLVAVLLLGAGFLGVFVGSRR